MYFNFNCLYNCTDILKMISLKMLVVHYIPFLILLCVIIKQSVCARDQETRLSSMKRRNVQVLPADYDEFNTISTYPVGRPRGLMPRLDNRNGMESVWPRPRPKCNRRIRIQNGVTRIRDKGSLVRYDCSFGFNLFGAKLAVCIRDQWSEPPPVCTKLGCLQLQQPSNGVLRLTSGGSVVAFFCNEGYRLEGNPVLYCDGNRWNGTEPKCTYIEPPTSATPPTTTMKITTSGESKLSPTAFGYNSSSTKNLEAWDYYVTSATPTTFQSQNISTESRYNQYNHTPLIDVNLSTTPYSIFVPVTESIISQPAHAGIQTTQNPTTDFTDLTTRNSFISLSITTEESRSQPVLMTEPQMLSTLLPKSTSEIPTIRTTTITSTIRPITVQPIINPIPTIPSVMVPLTTPKTQTTTYKPVIITFPVRLPENPLKTTPKSRSKTNRAWNIPTTKLLVQTTPEPIDDNFPFPNNAFKKFDEEISNTEFIDPIAPHKLDTNDSHEHHKLTQVFVVGGIILIVMGSVFVTGGFVMYCWRRNKGIARARSYDADGRTLSASDANDDFMWMEARDSRL